MAAMKLAEAGVKVKIVSLVPVKRSHSVCAQGGINGAVNLRGEGDSPFLHFEDTITGGDFLNHQPPVQRMCERAPAIIYLLDRLGVPFNRTNEGVLSFDASAARSCTEPHTPAPRPGSTPLCARRAGSKVGDARPRREI